MSSFLFAQAESTVPDEIRCDDQIFDINFYPRMMGNDSNVVAVGLINGAVDLWKCNANENTLLLKSNHHSASCRGVLFNESGEILYTISSDKSIQGIDSTGRVTLVYSDAHNDPINKIINLSDNLVATGDDGGVVKLWDIRVGGSEVKNWDWHDDFVSGLCFNSDQNTLLSIGGDAILCAYDLRINSKRYNERTHKTNLASRSDDQEAELSCISLSKGGKKVLCGSQDGVILIFSWGKWGDCSDRFPGHPETVDCLLPVDDSTVLSGSSDGLIRVLSIHPNKVLGVLGDHDGFPVEALAGSVDGRLLASIAHDERARFWDTALFADDVAEAEREREEGGEEQDDKEDGGDRGDVEVEIGHNSGSESHSSQIEEDDHEDDEENDEEDDEEDEGDDDEVDMHESDESDSEPSRGGGGARKRLPTNSERFFADL